MGSATIFSELVANPASEKVFLLEANLAQELTGWTLTAAQTYTYEISFLNETITLADSSTENIRKEISGIKEDGTALTEQSSIATVEANAGSYWHDTANTKLYVHPSGSGDPADYTLIGYFWLYLGTKGIVLNNRYYEPYITEKGIPKLSQKNLNVHWGTSNIGSGSVKLLNGRGFFDQISKKFIWVNKVAKLLMGGDSLPYSEYETLFTGKIRDKTFTKQTFVLKLKSMSFDLLRSLPINNFWTSNYPNLDESAEGKPIPYYYGAYNAAQAPEPTCINTAYDTDALACTADSATDFFTDVAHDLVNTERIFIGGDSAPTGVDTDKKYYVVNKTTDTFQISETSGGSVVDFSDNGTNVTWRYPTYQFRLCDHAIKSITQVYIDYDGGSGWQTISHNNENLTTAKFTIIAQNFELGTGRIKISFEGKHSASVLIETPPAIAEDLFLTYCGYAAGDLLASSFTTSKVRTEMELNVPIERSTKALSIIEKICASDLAFFDEDGDGKLRYRTWEPELGSPPIIDDGFDILSKPLPKVIDDTVSLFWKIKVAYSWLGSQDKSLYAEESNVESRYKYEKEEVLTHETYLRGSSDASRLGQRLLLVLQDPSPLLTIDLKATQITKTLGDKFKITLSRAPLMTGSYSERPFEIFGISKSFFPLIVKIQARDLPDYASNIGFWSADTTPDYDSATEAERASSGFWTDDDGYADPTDEDSRHKSRWW